MKMPGVEDGQYLVPQKLRLVSPATARLAKG
jgi:hypothetical protein